MSSVLQLVWLCTCSLNVDLALPCAQMPVYLLVAAAIISTLIRKHL